MDGSALPTIDALPNRIAISKAPPRSGYRVAISCHGTELPLVASQQSGPLTGVLRTRAVSESSAARRRGKPLRTSADMQQHGPRATAICPTTSCQKTCSAGTSALAITHPRACHGQISRCMACLRTDVDAERAERRRPACAARVKSGLHPRWRIADRPIRKAHRSAAAPTV
jgi:hypothetical protein